MKTIETFSGESYIITEEEYASLIAKVETEQKFFRIKSADKVINKSDIKSFGAPETIATWWGHVLDKGGKSFMRDGERCYLEPHNFAQIEHKLHPKYGLGPIDVTNETKELEEGGWGGWKKQVTGN